MRTTVKGRRELDCEKCAKVKSFILLIAIFIGLGFTINSMIDNKNNQRRPWTEQEDQALKALYESLKINKWSHIAQQLEASYGFIGRTGKQCRQRYNNHLDPALSKDEWTFQEQKKLYHLHDDLGNKWAIISQQLNTGRTDNTIKNHFYSRLRKSLRRLNKIIQEKYKKQVREIQTKVLYKIIEASQEKFKLEPMCQPELSEYSCKLKNKILMFSYEEQECENYRNEDSAKDLIQQIIEFNRNYKRKPKKFRKIGSSYEHIDQMEKCEIKRNYSNRFDFAERGGSERSSSMSFSSFSSKDQPNGTMEPEEDSEEDEINPRIKVQTQKQKMISTIILTANPTKLQERTEKEQKIQNSEQILEALGLLQDDIAMPHPIFLKKNTSLMSSQHSQDAQQFKFFDDSQAEMKIMSTPILTGFKKQSMEDRLFH